MAPILSWEYWFGWVTDCFARKRTPERNIRRSLLVLGIFWFFTGVEYAVILPSAWQFLQNLGATNKIWLSASISAFSFANFLFSPVYGRFADRYSTKTILIVSGAFGLVGNVVYFFANDPYTNVEARFIAGMGAAAGSAIFAYIARVSVTPLDMNKNMGAVMTARAVGLIVGPAFNFFLVKINWRIGDFHVDPYNSPGALMVIVWILCLACVVFYFHDLPKEPLVSQPPRAQPTIKTKQPMLNESISSPEQRMAGPKGSSSSSSSEEDDDDDDDEEPANKEDDTPRCSEFCGLGVGVLLLIQFLNMFNQTAYETFVTPFTQRVFHWNQVNNSIVYMITAVLAIGVYIAMTKTQRYFHISDRAEILVGISLQLVGFALFWAIPAHSAKELWKFAVASVVFVVGLPFVYIAPALQAKLTSKRTQGFGQGIRRSVLSAAQIIGPLWATLSAEENGVYFWGGMLGLTALSIVIMVIGWRQLYFKMPDHLLTSVASSDSATPNGNGGADETDRLLGNGTHKDGRAQGANSYNALTSSSNSNSNSNSTDHPSLHSRHAYSGDTDDKTPLLLSQTQSINGD